MLGKNSSRQHFSHFSQKIGFDVSYKLSPKETVDLKCQMLFSGKNKENINLSSAKFAHCVLSQ